MLREAAATPNTLVRRFTDRFWKTDWPGSSHPSVFYDPRALDPQGPGGVLHAKAIVADDEAVFVTSANLTEAALDRNIELGILVRDRAFALTVCTDQRMQLRFPPAQGAGTGTGERPRVGANRNSQARPGAALGAPRCRSQCSGAACRTVWHQGVHGPPTCGSGRRSNVRCQSRRGAAQWRQGRSAAQGGQAGVMFWTLTTKGHSQFRVPDERAAAQPPGAKMMRDLGACPSIRLDRFR